MPRLQILQHKSYHPYLEKNKQRVREDEAKAAEAEMAKEQKRVEKDSEARLLELRRRAGSPSVVQANNEPEEDDNLPSTSTTRDLPVNDLLEKHRKKKAREEKRERKQRDRLDFEFPSETSARRDKGKGKEKDPGIGLERIVVADQTEGGEEKSHDRSWDDHGHINFFLDVEQAAKPKPAPTLAEINKKKLEQEADKFTMYLGRPEREMKPWYTDRELKRVEEKAVGEEAEYRRARDQRKDVRSKERNDPLTQVKALLKPTNPSPNPPTRRHPSSITSTTPKDPQTARANREQSERERALALIAKSKAQPRGKGTWEDTPSTIANGGRSWAEDLERQKDKARNRFWDEERERDRVRGWEKGVRGERGGRAWEV